MSTIIFCEIMDQLGLRTSDIAQNAGSEIELLDVALLDAKEQAFSDTTLYFGFCVQINAQGRMPRHCVLALGCGGLIEYTPTANVAVVDEFRLSSLFNKATAIVRECNQHTQFYETLVKQAAAGNLQGFMQVAAARFGNPLLLLDRNFFVLAHAPAAQTANAAWQAHIQRGYLAYPYAANLMQSTAGQAAIDEGAGPIECKDASSGAKEYYCRILHEGRQVGTILARDDTPTAHENRSLLSVIACAAGSALARHAPHALRKHTPQEDLLRDLLIGAAPGDVRARSAAHIFPEHMCALAIQSLPASGHAALQSGLVQLLPARFCGAHMVLWRDAAAILCPLGDAGGWLPGQAGEWAQFAQAHALRIGVSNPFQDACAFATYYGQARTALDCSARFQAVPEHVSYYADWFYHELLDTVGPRVPLDQFCHPSLHILRDYDQKNGTDLYMTLRTHLQHSCNLKTTASALFIHRNSLAYRIDRIVQLTGLDLSDSHTKFLLQTSYAIARHLECGGKQGGADQA